MENGGAERENRPGPDNEPGNTENPNNQGELDPLRRGAENAEARDQAVEEFARAAAERMRTREARVGERFFPEDISDEYVLWDTLENAILVEESAGRKFDDNKASTLIRAIQLELSSKPLVQEKMFKLFMARYNYKNLSNLMAIGAAEPYADLLLQMEAADHKAILELPGMTKTEDTMLPGAIEILDDAEIWRKDGGVKPEHKLAIARSIMGNINEMEGYRKRFGLAPTDFTENEINLLLKDEEDLIEVDKQQKDAWSKEKRGAADRLFKQVKRNINLATTAHNLVGNSAKYDGLVFKPEYGGGYIEFTNIPLEVPKALGGGIINLADVLSGNLSDGDKAKLELVRKTQGHIIPMAWDRAMRKFYTENWEKIDFDESLGGKAAGIIKTRFHNPIRYEKAEERYPGAPGTEPLKKATYVGILPLVFMTMRTSVAEQLANWQPDTKSRIDAAGRVKGGEKARKMFNEDGPKLLYNPEAIGGFAQSLKDFKEAMGYLPGEEQQEQMAYIIEPIAKFSMDSLKKVFKYENQNAYTIDNGIRITRERGYINSQQENILKNEVILRRSIFKRIPILSAIAMEMKIAFGGALKSSSALLEMVKIFLKQVFSPK